LSFVNFQGKLTGTSWNLLACEASLFGLLCAWRKVQILRQQPSATTVGRHARARASRRCRRRPPEVKMKVLGKKETNVGEKMLGKSVEPKKMLEQFPQPYPRIQHFIKIL
jgi:hypothetical protein